MLQPEIMVPPLLWLVSDGAAGVTARRFIAADWDPSGRGRPRRPGRRLPGWGSRGCPSNRSEAYTLITKATPEAATMMNLSEYARHDGLGLAELVARNRYRPRSWR